MLERPDELLQHRAVELGLCAADLEVGALAELARRSAQDPVQALGQAAERHRANREQLLLHVARKPALRTQRGVGDVEVLEERLLDGRDVVDALAQRTRELLKARIAVEFQRIESFLALAHLHEARLDLRFGLDLDFAHLRAQTYHAAGELEQVRLQRAELAFDARTRDRHFAGFVDQPVDDVGAHAQHRAGARFQRRRHRLAAALRRVLGRGQRHDHVRSPGARRAHPRRPLALPASAAPPRPCRRPRQRRRWSCPRATRRERRRYGRGRRRAPRTARADRGTGAPSMSSRDSIRCTSSPRRIAPAIRALPLNVWSVRRNWRARASSRGRAAPCAQLLARLRIELGRFLEKDRQHLRVDVVANVRQRILRNLAARRFRRETRRSRRRDGRHDVALRWFFRLRDFAPAVGFRVMLPPARRLPHALLPCASASAPAASATASACASASASGSASASARLCPRRLCDCRPHPCRRFASPALLEDSSSGRRTVSLDRLRLGDRPTGNVIRGTASSGVRASSARRRRRLRRVQRNFGQLQSRRRGLGLRIGKVDLRRQSVSSTGVAIRRTASSSCWISAAIATSVALKLRRSLTRPRNSPRPPIASESAGSASTGSGAESDCNASRHCSSAPAVNAISGRPPARWMPHRV